MAVMETMTVNSGGTLLDQKQTTLIRLFLLLAMMMLEEMGLLSGSLLTDLLLAKPLMRP